MFSYDFDLFIIVVYLLRQNSNDLFQKKIAALYKQS